MISVVDMDPKRFDAFLIKMNALRAAGIRGFRDGGLQITFEALPAQQLSATLPDPEQTRAIETETKPDIFDVLESGKIPGSPGVDEHWNPATDV